MKRKVLFSILILIGVFMFSSADVLTVSADTASAATSKGVCEDSSMKDVKGIINWGSCMLYKTIVPFLFALATVAFIWGVMEYYLNPGNEEKRKKGKDYIFGGLIALFVMISIWGLVGIFTNTFEVKNTVPQLPGE